MALCWVLIGMTTAVFGELGFLRDARELGFQPRFPHGDDRACMFRPGCKAHGSLLAAHGLLDGVSRYTRPPCNLENGRPVTLPPLPAESQKPHVKHSDNLLLIHAGKRLHMGQVSVIINSYGLTTTTARIWASAASYPLEIENGRVTSADAPC